MSAIKVNIFGLRSHGDFSLKQAVRALDFSLCIGRLSGFWALENDLGTLLFLVGLIC